MGKATSETAKATVVAGKDRAIVLAAHKSFLRDGFAGASMDAIARGAGVSVKTIYSHFQNKNELFSRVMVAACTDPLLSGETPSDEVLCERFPWFSDSTQRGLLEAGKDYLRHLLSEEQLALYRVVTRDADRFPELGMQYREHVARGRTGILAAYFHSRTRAGNAVKRNSSEDAALYEALLRADVYEGALHGLLRVDAETIDQHAGLASRRMWKIFSAD